ncbi:DNA-binding protein [Pholiota conissans]|uniref:DNA-binding protein n=1 Tax=Pholiota conissans TaxID=109636 RepID=A0A9P5YWA7_9AGAR|nr:DNA-binding protein [Pholiota conissans]
MQNQHTRNTTQSISQSQSLAAVQTLLRAGLGTITYLRNLLPEDNFTRNHFTSVDDFSSLQADASQESTSSRTNVSGFRITTITRGYTDEADRILNYMEYGIFDALEKRYLRSFIFGIYLASFDTKDPNNIVEAYTFNFKYHKIPGSDIFVPLVSLAEKQKKNAEDPLARAIKNGKPPTLRDVKMSVKALLKTLIQAISNMDVLPRRRFATFKVFYTEETPADYEPPHFEPGDAEKDKWFFMTHDLDEVPERTSIGKVDTSHHSVNLNVTSIASYLPSSSEHGDDAIFSGLTANPVRSNLTPIEEATLCKNQIEKQLEDAKNRNLVWPVEDVVDLEDLDAEGEDDPDYIKLADGAFKQIDAISPIGVRNGTGSIEAVPMCEETEEAHFGGISESVPRRLHEIVTEKVQIRTDFEETQPLLLTPKNNGSEAPMPPTSRSNSNYRSTLTPLSTAPTSPAREGFDPEMLKNIRIDVRDAYDTEMLDLETQAPPEELTRDSARLGEQNSGESIMDDTASMSIEPKSDKGVQCDCGLASEGELCYCDGGCQKWFHLWCMGYHTIDDPRLPSKFICFDCRLRKDIHWDLIKVDLYPQMMSKFRDIAIFRRAIKVAQTLKCFTSLQYSGEFGNIWIMERLSEATNAFLILLVPGGDPASAVRMLKLLEDQDYVLRESIGLDDMGLKVATRTKKGKAGAITTAKSKNRKNVQKLRYVFNQKIQSSDSYLDYFKPNEAEMETRLLGLHEFIKPKQTRETQTQTQETQAELVLGPGKRGIPHNLQDQPAKKLKISVAIGVDLAE